jgi:prephenate dehydrogenase
VNFKKVAILGGGLLGGSLALALRTRCHATLWCRRDVTVAEARKSGVERVTADLAGAVADADLLILAVPVGAMKGLVEAAIEAGLPRGAVISDVGSVKAVVHRQLAPVAAAAGMHWIGGHPMAGSEKQGFESARSDLFAGAACLLTDDGSAPEASRESLAAFWQGVGCRVHWLAPEAHDALVARISHLPHVMSAATAMIAMASPADAAFGGGGLRDTTRVAGGDPPMWAEILQENRAALLEPMRQVQAQLAEVLQMLEKDDQSGLLHWLESARARHKDASEFRETSRDE